MLHEKAASRNSKLEHENEVSETGLLQKLSEVPSFWGHCQIWLLCERDTKSCRTQFSLPLFCPFAKTQFYFFFLQTTHSLYSCLPWFLTELPTSPTGPSNSCIRFFFLVFFFCFVAQSFAILNANKRARLWGRISRDHAYHRRWEWEETGGKKNKIWLSFHKPGGGAEPLELSYALGKRSPLVEALVHETRTTVLILYTQYHQR